MIRVSLFSPVLIVFLPFLAGIRPVALASETVASGGRLPLWRTLAPAKAEGDPIRAGQTVLAAREEGLESYIDITGIHTELRGEELSVYMSLALLPQSLTFNRSGGEPNQYEYSWMAFLDLDDNLNTGYTESVYRGADVLVSLHHILQAGAEPIEAPLQEMLRGEVLVSTGGTRLRFIKSFAPVYDYENHTILLRTELPTITLRARMVFLAYDALASRADFILDHPGLAPDDGPGNSIYDPMALQVGASHSSKADFPGDWDLYRFEIEDFGEFSVDLDGPGSARIKLYRESGRDVTGLYSEEMNGTAKTLMAYLDPGVYYLGVGADAEGGYDLFTDHKPLPRRRWVPHLTDPSGDFETRIILANEANGAIQVVVHPYHKDGTPGASFTLGLQANRHIELAAADLFPDPLVSHFSIEGDAAIRFYAAYRSLIKSDAGVAHVPDLQTLPGLSFELYPADWNHFWDAVAIVNAGDEPASIEARQYDAEDRALRGIVWISDLAPQAKTLAVLSDLFSPVEGQKLLIQSTSPLQVLFLRGSKADQSAILFRTEGLRRSEPLP